MSKFRSLIAGTKGIAAVEFALLSPVFMLFMSLLIDLGLAYSAKLKIVAGTSAAAQYAYSNGQTVTSATVATFLTNVAAVAKKAADTAVAPTVTVTFNNASDSSNLSKFYCVTGSSPTTLTWTSTGTSSTSCGSNLMSGRFVTITLATTTTTIFFPNSVVSSVINETDATIVRIE